MSEHIGDDDLMAWLDGDVAADRSRQIELHVRSCPQCRELVGAVGRSDAALHQAARAEAPAAAVHAAWSELAAALAPAPPAEVLTLQQAAELLQVSAKQLGEVMDELPVFEIAGELRIRRSRLMEWIGSRERDFVRQRSQSWVARATSIGQGVA